MKIQIRYQECQIDKEDVDEISAYNWSYHAKTGFCTKKNYKTLYMHRLITKCPDFLVVDHIDGDKRNNLRSNLRICTQSQNTKNQKIPKNNKSGYKGVSFDTWAYKKNLRKCWIARIKVNRKGINLGRFLTPEEAANVYNEAAVKYFGEFANLNII